jgi:hypothetical protein
MKRSITATVSEIATYCTVLTADLVLKLGYTLPKKTVSMIKSNIAEDVRTGALERAPSDYRNLLELLDAVEVAEELKKEQQKNLGASKKTQIKEETV